MGNTDLAIPDKPNDSQLMMLNQKTPPNLIRFRIGRGGKQFAFVDGAEVIRALNNAFVWDWDFETDQEELIHFEGVPFEIKVRGRLTVRTKTGRTVTKMQYGSQAIEMNSDKTRPVSIGDCYKGAATDALKKCASELGLFLDLYDSDANITPATVERAQQEQRQATSTQWTRDLSEWEKFKMVALECGMNVDTVREILQVASMHDYKGTREQAEQEIRKVAALPKVNIGPGVKVKA
jgi:recombination DNA repair RAD52 pathway protein